MNSRLMYTTLCYVASTVALCLIANSDAADYAAEVYRDDRIVIHAGISGSSSPSVQFGDVLTLTVAVAYDPASISIANLDEQFFSSAWPSSSGVSLLNWESRRDSANESKFEAQRYLFRFQVVGCPDEETTCPGDRSYSVPEFALPFENRRAPSDDVALNAISFRPWPETLNVSSNIVTDVEDQLYPFENYFPTGGYPDPLQAADNTRVSLVAAGIASSLLIGAMLMWPFDGSRQKKAAAAVPRWQACLQQLREEDINDEGRYFDSLRRCVVFYCNDELGVDPFVWLDLAEQDEAVGSDRGDAELRSLFSELLLNPAGCAGALRARLERLIAQAGPTGA